MNKKINSELFLVMWHKKTFTLKYNSFILKSSEKSLSRDFKIHHRHCLETSEQNTEKHHCHTSSVSRCSYVDVLEVFSISQFSFDLNFMNQTTTVTIASSATAPQTHPIITPTEFEDVASRRQSSSVRTVVGLLKKEMPSNTDDTETSNDDVPETTLSFV